jgi:hypothetical protein
MKSLEKREILKGNVTSGVDGGYKKLGFISVHDVGCKTNEKSPDYIGILSLNGIGVFAVSLWKGNNVVVVNENIKR